MPHTISDSLRQSVIQRAARCCEFCLICQDDVPQQHEIDHLIARKHGGQTIAENLALTCFPCNRYKGADLTAIDPDTHQVAPLFNPRVQMWNDHFTLVGAKIIGRTPVGRATAALLRFNLPVRVDHRRLLIQKSRYPPAHLNLRTNE
jgi:hypothetical protein